jgi:hypothetical protein
LRIRPPSSQRRTRENTNIVQLVGTAGNDTLTQASNGSNGFEIFGLGGNDTIRLLRDDDLDGDIEKPIDSGI